jgi:hypothetical protein
MRPAQCMYIQIKQVNPQMQREFRTMDEFFFSGLLNVSKLKKK